MTFNPTYQGKVYSMANGYLYTLRADGKLAYAGAEYDRNVTVALTGYAAVSAAGNTGYQTTGGYYIILSEGWQEIGTVSIYQYSVSQAQALVDKIIKNNIQIVQNNLVCARYASKFTPEQQSLIRDLQNRVKMRNDALQSGGLCGNVQTSYPKGYTDLQGYLDALMQGNAIGIATWAVVVIVATVIAATATAAYFAYKAFADESEKDVKFSKELMAVLAEKLTPDEYQQLLDETKGIVTKARIKQAASSYGNVLWIVGIATAALLVARVIKNRMA